MLFFFLLLLNFHITKLGHTRPPHPFLPVTPTITKLNGRNLLPRYLPLPLPHPHPLTLYHRITQPKTTTNISIIIIILSLLLFIRIYFYFWGYCL